MSGSNCGSKSNTSTSGVTKWECPSCTYENWPASSYCTLCRTPQNNTLVKDEVRQGHVSVCELEAAVGSRPSSAEHQPVDVTGIHQSHTQCSSCTYINKPTAFKCEQCFNVLCDPPPDDKRTFFDNFPVTCSTAFPQPGVASASAVSSLNFDQQTKNKWICSRCTYDNWPKSQHCVMCRMSPTIPSVGDLLLASTTEIGKEVFELRPAASPKSTSGGSPSEITDPGSAAVNLGVVGRRPIAISGGLLSVRDKLWLAACRAVVNCELEPIERYLCNGGHVDRKLTKQECCLLNASLGCEIPDKGSSGHMDEPISTDNTGSSSTSHHNATFSSTPGHKRRIRAGLTLTDLAVCYGQADLINLFVAVTGLQATGCTISSYNSASSSSSSSPPSSRNSKNSARPQSVSSKSRQPTQRSSPASSSTNLSTTTPSSAALALAPSLQQLIIRPPGHAQPTSGNSFTSRSRCKWMPCQASPHIARDLQETISSTIRYRKGDFSCAYFTEWSTFALPNSITKLPPSVKYLVLSELCDTQAQSELEDDAKAINWWFIPRQKQASCLFALWNRTAGDCLLDSVLQACWGIFDRENHLRHTLAESLCRCEASFYSRWRDYEALQAACHYILDEAQCRRDWENVLAAAKQPKGALEQIHIFALSHILRRPIIVYGVRYIKNYRNEPIGIANFQGIYLPLLWERSFCSRNPIVLGYTRGHFTALVPMEPPVTSSTPPESASASSRLPSPRITSSATSTTGSQRHNPSASTSTPELNSSSEVVAVNTPSTVLPPPPGASSATEAGHGEAANTTAAPFVYLPLVDRQGGFLPIHFTTEKEADISQTLLRDWLDVVSTRRGLPLARLRLQPRHMLVSKMTDEWLDSYRSLARLSTTSGGHVVRTPISSSNSSSLNSSSSSSDHETPGSANSVNAKADS